MKLPTGYQIMPANETHVQEIAANNRHSIFEQIALEISEEQALHGALTALNYPNSKFFVVVDADNKVVAQYKHVQVWNDLVARPMIWVERLYVQPAYRRLGFAKLLIEHCLETHTVHADGYPLPLLVSMIEKNNNASIELAKSNGFTEHDYYILFHQDAVNEVRAMSNNGPE